MISIVIPAYNEEKMIGKCLESLVNQKTNYQFEVIVVNNNSTDETVKIAKGFEGKLDLKLVDEKEKGRGSARYTGFKVARGDIILSTDADSILPPEWVENLTNELKTSDAVAITGTLVVKDRGWFHNIILSSFYVPFMTLYELTHGYYWLSGFNFAIYKDKYEQVGGFKFGIDAQEDLELASRVRKIGKIKLVTSIPIVFSGRRFKNGLLKGMAPYIKTYISYFWLKKDRVLLPDVR